MFLSLPRQVTYYKFHGSRKPKKLEEVLEDYAAHLYYQVHFEQLRPHIRVWMSAWFFLQRRNQRDYQILDEHVVKELNHHRSTLMQLLK